MIAPRDAQKLEGASHFVIILARINIRYDSEYFVNVKMLVYGLKQSQEKNWNILNSERALYDCSSKQTYITLANMISASAQIGIDSTAIEGFNFDDVHSLLESESLL